MCALIVRPFQADAAGYERLTVLWNSLNPEWPRRADLWQRIDARAAADRGGERPGAVPRVIAESDGVLVGVAEWSEASLAAKGAFDLTFLSRPEADGVNVSSRLWDALEPSLWAQQPRRLHAYVRDTRPWEVAFFEGRGFVNQQQTAFSALDVTAFDAAPHADTLMRVADQGYTLRSIAELQAEGDDWQRPYWELDNAILADVPVVGGFEPQTFEKFMADLVDPDRFWPEASFVLLRGEGAAQVHAGGSRLTLPSGLPEWTFAGLTGVRREHRRRGLATALKLATVAYAREHGHTLITSLNEVDNPMLALNLSLGFKTRYLQLTMERVLHPKQPGQS